jgi:hypothetical protein
VSTVKICINIRAVKTADTDTQVVTEFKYSIYNKAFCETVSIKGLKSD